MFLILESQIREIARLGSGNKGSILIWIRVLLQLRFIQWKSDIIIGDVSKPAETYNNF